MHWGTMTLPLACCWMGKNCVKRQSKSVVSLLPVSQTPLAWESGTSKAVTVMTKGVLTWLKRIFMEWALGSVQGEVPEGQLTVATWETSVPGVKGSWTAVTVGAGAEAVPVRETFCCEPGMLPALSVTTTIAVRIPMARGAKPTWAVQEFPAGNILGKIGQLWERVYSAGLAPASAMLEMESGPVPVLLMVTGRVALVVPMTWFVKVSVEGVTPAPGTTTAGVTVSTSMGDVTPLK